MPESYWEHRVGVFTWLWIEHWIHEQLEQLQLGKVERFATIDEYDEYLETCFRRDADAAFRDELDR